MSWPSPGQIDPVVRDFEISVTDKIATMGSCFAQHMARHVQAAGLHHYVAEPAPADMDPATARQRGYGVYSARYGNVYTPRQALQLFDRAFGLFQPVDDVWETGDGYVDAFRPVIEPDSLGSKEAVKAQAQLHLSCVRDVFLNSDWLVFTLGLTESWSSRIDGAVYPLAPGVRAGAWDPQIHQFINLTIQDLREDLDRFIEKISGVNKNLKILLTVSPVPLVATYERRHVLVSTVYSKSALRVAVDEMERKHEHVHYFPSYEIITSPAFGGRFFQDDLREVNELGVAHVMRLFKKHCVSLQKARSQPPTGASPGPAPSPAFDIACDDRWIEQARRASGFG